MADEDDQITLTVTLLASIYETLELLTMFENANKSTVINRAIKVYKLVTDAEDVVLDGVRIKFIEE